MLSRTCACRAAPVYSSLAFCSWSTQRETMAESFSSPGFNRKPEVIRANVLKDSPYLLHGSQVITGHDAGG